MRPSVRPLTQALDAYAKANVPTTTLIHDLTTALATELSRTMGGPVTISLPGGILITRGKELETAA
jgi:hypothetical protein